MGGAVCPPLPKAAVGGAARPIRFKGRHLLCDLLTPFHGRRRWCGPIPPFPRQSLVVRTASTFPKAVVDGTKPLPPFPKSSVVRTAPTIPKAVVGGTDRSHLSQGRRRWCEPLPPFPRLPSVVRTASTFPKAVVGGANRSHPSQGCRRWCGPFRPLRKSVVVCAANEATFFGKT